MNKKEILDILDNAKDEKGSVPMRLVRQALDKLPTIQPVATDTNVRDTISRKGVFIPNITVEMFRNASLEGVEDLMASGEMEDISLLSAQPEKEIPKRVLWNGWKGVRDTRYKCPNCKKPVRNTDIYCHRCGQKLMFPNIDFTPYVEGKKQELIVRWDDEE